MFTLLLVITSNLNSALEKEGEEKGKISIDVFTIASFFMLIALFTNFNWNRNFIIYNICNAFSFSYKMELHKKPQP